MPVEYLDPEIAGEGQSANNWQPGAMDWMNAPSGAEEEYQPDIEPPHIPDYAALKKHKHYKQYFRPYRYHPFPSWMYHATQEPKIVKSKEEALALGPSWTHTPLKPRIDMTGKSLPVKSDTQRLTEALVAGLVKQGPSNAADPTAIAAIVSAVMAAMASVQPAKVTPVTLDPESLMPIEERTTANEGLRSFLQNPPDENERTVDDDKNERLALFELAEKEGVKIDKRWSNQRIKEALGI